MNNRDFYYEDLLIDIAKDREEKFSRWKEYIDEIKGFVEEKLGESVEVIVFGSVVRGDYTIGLSDIDILIVSEKFKNRNIRYQILGELLIRYSKVFEFHLVTPKEKKFYLKFIKENMLQV